MPFGLPGFRKKEHSGSLLDDVRTLIKVRLDQLNWPVMWISIGITTVLVGGFFYFSGFTIPHRDPEPVFFESWPANRSEAEIRARLERDKPIEEERAKRLAELEAKRQADLQAIKDFLGTGDIER